MFFGSGMFGQLPQKQEVAPIQGYQTQVAPGSGQVLTGSIPQSVDQSLVPYANQQATGVGSANTFGMPQGMPGVGSGATPPYVPQSQQAPSQQPQQAPTAAPVTIEGTVEEAGTTGDPMVDGAIQQGMTPAVIPLRKPMSTNRKLSALGMMMSAAGTDSFTRVAGTVQAGLAQDEASVEKYNRDLIAATKPTVTTEYRNDQYVKVTTPPSYKLSADGQSIEFIGPQSPTIEKIEGGDLRDAPERAIKTDAEGHQRYVDNGEYVFPDQQPSAETLNEMSAEARTSTARFARDVYDERAKPYEDAIDKADMAVSYADVYYATDDNGGLASTKEQRTQADRALIKAVEKLWDANSAVLQGEFEAAESSQDVITQLKRAADPTTGEVLGDGSRAAMLDIIQRASGEMIEKYNRGARDAYASARAGFEGYENYDNNLTFALPSSARWLDENGEFVGKQVNDKWGALSDSDWYKNSLNISIPPEAIPGNLEEQASEILQADNKFKNRAGR